MLETLKARKEQLEAQGKKGFTLMEMLIVIAIIAVLVAIAIPILANQLENAREATDAANVRSAYAEVAAAALQYPDQEQAVTVDKAQTIPDWQSAASIGNIAGVAIGSVNSDTDTTIEYDPDTGVITIDGQEVESSHVTIPTP